MTTHYSSSWRPFRMFEHALHAYLLAVCSIGINGSKDDACGSPFTGLFDAMRCCQYPSLADEHSSTHVFPFMIVPPFVALENLEGYKMA